MRDDGKRKRSVEDWTEVQSLPSLRQRMERLRSSMSVWRIHLRLPIKMHTGHLHTLSTGTHWKPVGRRPLAFTVWLCINPVAANHMQGPNVWSLKGAMQIIIHFKIICYGKDYFTSYILIILWFMDPQCKFIRLMMVPVIVVIMFLLLGWAKKMFLILWKIWILF